MSGSATIRYFAAARDLCATETDAFEIDAGGVTVEALLRALGDRHERFAPVAKRMRVAINGTFAHNADMVQPGDTVDVLPPLAGGSGFARVRQEPLSVDEVLARISHPGAGGINLFVGVVRDHADGKPVERLDYEAHPTLAASEIEAIEQDVMAEHADSRVCIVHRTGQLGLGDAAVIVGASAPHRAEAFDACRAAIEAIKKRVPIWKKEWHPDGESTWVNLEQK